MIKRTLFSADHESFRDSFRRFLDKEIAPFHADWEDQGYVDREVWRKAGANGFLCMGMPEEYGGSGADKLYTVVQPRDMQDAGPALEAELIAFCRMHLSHLKCPKSVDFEAELPRHPTGKLYKRLLRDRYWVGHASKLV